MRTAIAAPDPDDDPKQTVRRSVDPTFNAADQLEAFERTLKEVESDYARWGRAELYAALKPALGGRLTAEQRAGIEKQFGFDHAKLSTAIDLLRHRVRKAFLRQIENGGA